METITITPRVNHFDKIRNYLDFSKKNDFYYINILKRKKDQDVPEKHQSARTIKTYIIESLEQFDSKKEEIILMCDTFNARAGISTNRFNHDLVAFDYIIRCTELLKNGHPNFSRLYDSFIGEAKEICSKKRWLVDIDEFHLKKVDEVITYVNNQQSQFPKNVIDKFITNQGFHLLVEPFRSDKFVEDMKLLGIDATLHKTNYLALYYP